MDEKNLTHRDYARMAAQPLSDLAHECEVDVFHASGPGGQGVNTADSAVRMRHLPTGIVVVSRESRSQYRNRQLCLQKIREELARRAIPPKIRHATKPSRRARQRRMDEKHARSQIKTSRRRIRGEEDIG